MPTAATARREPARFHSAFSLVARAMRGLMPPEKLLPSEAALKYRILDNPGGGVSGPYTFDAAPHLRRPLDCLDKSSLYETVAVMGPGQSGKSDIGNNWLLHDAICDPADHLFLAPDKFLLTSYMQSQVARMINGSPALKERLGSGASDDNVLTKRFGGMFLFGIWPTAAQLRARPVPRARVDDYDAIPEDIDGEGNALVLIGTRQTTFEGFAKTYVNSSPALGVDRGIEAVVARGTDERWHVRCHLHCGEYFRLDFETCAKFDRHGTAEDARASAVVACPRCGGIYEQKDKQALMATGLWLGAGQTIAADGAIAGELRAGSIASFRIDGLMGFASWGRLAELWRSAELQFETTGDEHELRAVYNTRVGVNYVSRLDNAKPVAADDLIRRAQASDYLMGTVPPAAVCLTAAVDVQGNRFEVMVKAWGHGLESWVVDRFPILALDDGRTRIEPDAKLEHWRELLSKVIWRRYPVAGDAERSLPMLNVVIDTGGLDGVTDNAFAFWHAAVQLGVPPTALTLVKGGNNPNARLLPPPTIDAKRQIKGRPEAALYVPNVNRIKSTIDARLRRVDSGFGKMHWPSDMPPHYLAELVAERKVDGVWKKPHGVANETLDLEVYSYVGILRHGSTDPSLTWVPAWARPSRKPAAGLPALPAGEPGGNAATVGVLGAPPARPATPRRRVRVKVRGRA